MALQARSISFVRLLSSHMDNVHDGVARIMAAGGAGADTRLLAEDIAELSLALVP